MNRLLIVGAGLLTLSACGGGGGNKTTTTSTTPTCVTGPLAAVKTPTLVTVSGADASGIDIDVGGAQSCPSPNAVDLGIANIGAASITASNIGAQVHRGDAKTVILFGPGLAGVNTVTISGQPNDFIITNILHKPATDGTPGVQFDIAVSPSAAFGARSVVLRAGNDDITTFTGGLEVVP